MRCIVYGKMFLAVSAVCGLGLAPFTGAVHAQSDAGKIHFFQYEDASRFPSFHTTQTAGRVRRLTEWCIPEPAGNPWQTVFETGTEPGYENFHAKGIRKDRKTVITLPPDFQNWNRNPECIRKIFAWNVLARLGHGPEIADTLTGHWIIRGLTEKMLTESRNQVQNPFVRYYPAAYALASRGIYPELDFVLISEPEGIPEHLQKWNAEYASLLLEACGKAGLFRNNLAKILLNDVIAGRENGNSRKAFLDFPVFQTWQTSPHQWFQKSLREQLLAFFSPTSPVHFEKLYWQTAQIELPDGQVCSLAELPFHAAKFKDYSAVVGKLERSLRFDTKIPQDLQKPLAELRKTLLKSRQEKDPQKASGMIRKAEEKLIAETERLENIETYLSQVQAKRIHPGARMQHLLRAVRSFRNQTPGFAGAEKLLDKWDETK